MTVILWVAIRAPAPLSVDRVPSHGRDLVFLWAIHHQLAGCRCMGYVRGWSEWRGLLLFSESPAMLRRQSSRSWRGA